MFIWVDMVRGFFSENLVYMLKDFWLTHIYIQMKRMLLNIYLRQILIFFRFLLRLSNSKNVRLRYLSSMNEVIKTVLNFLFIFLPKDFTRTKKHKKAQKSTKSTKKHKMHKNTTKQKHKNVNKWTKIKNALKKHLTGKK